MQANRTKYTKFVIATALLLMPAVVSASEAPLLLFFAAQWLVCITVAAVGWKVCSVIPSAIARSYLRLLIVVLICTPVPTGDRDMPFYLSGPALWFWESHNFDHLNTALSIGIVAVLGAILLVIRAALPVYFDRPRD
ncbi:MAG: hypothetical protein ABI411_17975 [Tahibacter sp.]